MVYLSEADVKDLEFGCSQDVDFIAASFVRCAQDVLDVREVLKRCNKEEIMIIAKIENMQGIKNVEEILEVADGLMVARGDMGVEVDFDMLPAIQKDMISKCYRAGKIVVTATQMLESMTKNPRPTRAEVSDVANAVFDRTVATMLSGESAAGLYPVEAVTAMSKINLSAEKDSFYLESDEIPYIVKRTFVTSEDRKFYDHKGVDYKAVLRAFFALIKNDGEVTQGGSTITQQLARNIFLSHEVSLERKVKEMFIASELEKAYTKDEILEFYINNIYFGNGYYGIEAASMGYFNKTITELSNSEMIFLCAKEKKKFLC